VTTPGEGTFTYDAGTLVELVATPEVGYHFVSWTGDVETVADVNAASTALTMNGHYFITANFMAEDSGVWGRLSTPSVEEWVLAPGWTIVDHAVAVDGVVGYAIVESDGESRLLKSVDSAATWRDITIGLEDLLEAGQYVTGLLQVACDGVDADFVAVALELYDGIGERNVHVYISDDGGLTFADAGEVAHAGVAISGDGVFELAVSREVGGKRDVAIGGYGSDGYGALFRCQAIGDVAGPWEDATGYEGWDDDGAFMSLAVVDIQFSPSWVVDKTVLAVTANDTAVWLQFGTWAAIQGWNRRSGLGIAPVRLIDSSGTTSVPWSSLAGLTAGIALPSDYSGMHLDKRNLWVWVNHYDSSQRSVGVIFRVRNTAVMPISRQIGNLPWLTNVSYRGTIAEGRAIAGMLGTGTHDSTYGSADDLITNCGDGVQVYRNDGITNMDICCLHWECACKPPTGRLAMDVAYVGEAMAYAVALGPSCQYNEGAWSVSFDDGETWNQLSLINTHIDYLSDVAVSPDSNDVMLVAANLGSGCGCDSVWLKTTNLIEAPEYSGKWLRTWCGQLQGVNEESSQRGLLRLAPEQTDGATVYLLDRMTDSVYRNDRKTLGCWERITAAPLHAIVDLVVKDADHVYALDSDGDVAMRSGHGWCEPVYSGVNAGWTIAAYGDDVLVGGQHGEIAYSEDGGRTFTALEKLPLGASYTLVSVAFDSHFEESGVIYAAVAGVEVLEPALQDMTGGIYRWAAGEVTHWENLGAESYAYTGLVLGATGDILYASYVAVSHDGKIVTGAARCLTPADQACCEGSAWDYLNEGLSSNTAFCMVPAPLKLCSGVTPATRIALFGIGIDTESWRYDMENGRYGTVWRLVDAFEE